jgi:hypothetical protein
MRPPHPVGLLVSRMDRGWIPEPEPSAVFSDRNRFVSVPKWRGAQARATFADGMARSGAGSESRRRSEGHREQLNHQKIIGWGGVEAVGNSLLGGRTCLSGAFSRFRPSLGGHA